MQFIQNAAMMNHAYDEMDFITGFRTGGRIPVAELAMMTRGKTVHNNISLNNSSVGFINTGDIEKIDAAITITKGTDLENIGALLKEFVQIALNSGAIAEQDKKHIAELTEALSRELITSKKQSVIMSLLKSLEGIAEKCTPIMSIFGKLSEALARLFE